MSGSQWATGPAADVEYTRIVEAAAAGDSHELLQAISGAPDCSAMTDLHDDLDGTLHYHVIDRAMIMIRAGVFTSALAEGSRNALR